MEKTAQDQKQLLTEVIQKLMVLLGAELTLSKVKNVHGITVSEDGTVTDVQAEPEMLLREVIEEFVGLSGEIVKQITELLASKQMQQKTPVNLPAAPFQPEPQPAETMTMPTPTSMPTTHEEPATPAVDSTPTQPEQAPASQPTPETPAPEATPQQPTLSPDPFPTTQPVAMPTMPTPEAVPAQEHAEQTPASQPATETSTPAAATPTTAPVPGAAPAPATPDQTDPDMQHIINEALKQTK